MSEQEKKEQTMTLQLFYEFLSICDAVTFEKGDRVFKFRIAEVKPDGTLRLEDVKSYNRY